MKALSIAAVVLGIIFLIGSVAWGALFPASNSWTNEKFEQKADLGIKVRRLQDELITAQKKPSMHGGRNAAEIDAELKTATAELNALQDEFEGKRDAPKNASRILQWAGIAFVAAGALATFANKG
jgi:outer membrane murein-binding lipoprotein Lpp